MGRCLAAISDEPRQQLTLYYRKDHAAISLTAF
jgi:hypothetical protein